MLSVVYAKCHIKAPYAECRMLSVVAPYLSEKLNENS